MSGIFGKHRPSPTSSITVAVTVRDLVTDKGVNGLTGILKPDTGTSVTAVGDGRIGFVTTARGDATISLTAPGYDALSFRTAIVAELPERRMKPSLRPARLGVVRKDGSRGFRDDTGYFYPLGQTLFWGLNGYKFERERFSQNLLFLAKHNWDSIRMLCEVGWQDANQLTPFIDPAWPDYEEILAGTIDLAYDQYGLRTELTVVGGGTSTNYVELARRVATVVQGREHKILLIEAANEKFKNLDDDAILRQMVTILKLTGCLVAASDGGGDEFQWAKQTLEWGCDVGVGHLDRSMGDDGWRTVRQPWDWKDFPSLASQNEPVGPRSSVDQCDDPLILAMLRGTGILCGMGHFVLHNASGVKGQVDPAHDRPANLWEVPNIDAIMDAVRSVDAGLPEGCNEGQKWNAWWAGHPLRPRADMIWSDGNPNGVNRCYASSGPAGWVCALAGIKGFAVMIPRETGRLALFDPVSGETTYMDVRAEEPVRIEPASRDAKGYGAFIVRNA